MPKPRLFLALILTIAVLPYAFLQAGTAITLGEAMGQESLTWTTGGDADWIVDEAVTDGSNASLRSGNISAGQTTWVSTIVEGNAEINYYFKTSTEASNDTLILYLDGVDTYNFGGSGERDWADLHNCWIPAGTHELKWVYAKNDSIDAGSDTVWIDSLSITPVSITQPSDVWVDEGQDFTIDGSFTNGSMLTSYYWYKEGELLTITNTPDLTIESAKLSDAGTYLMHIVEFARFSTEDITVTVKDFATQLGLPIQSLNYGGEPWRNDDYESRTVITVGGPFPWQGSDNFAWIEKDFDGPAVVSFDWKLTSDDGDLFKVELDGKNWNLDPVDPDSWNSDSYASLGDGPHTIRWTYTKSDTESGNSDGIWIDNVSVTSPIISSLSSDVTITSGQELELTVATAITDDLTYTWLLNGNDIPESNSATYTVNQSLLSNAGEYRVRISTENWEITSDPITVTINDFGIPLDQADQVWEFGGNPWEKDNNYAGRTVVTTGNLTPNDNSWFELTIPGSATVSFDWKLSSDDGDTLQFEINGSSNDLIPSDEDTWETSTFVLTEEQNHVIRWRYTESGSESGAADRSWIDHLEIDQTPIINSVPGYTLLDPGSDSTITIDATTRGTVTYQWYFNGEELTGENNLNLTISNSGFVNSGMYYLKITTKHDEASSTPFYVSLAPHLNAGLDINNALIEQNTPNHWFRQELTGRDRGDAVTLPMLDAGQTASFSTLEQAPCTISFWYKIAEGSNIDGILVSVDESPAFLYEGNGNWQKAIFTYPETSTGRIRFSVTNNGATIDSPEAWVDNLVFTPLGSGDLAMVLLILEAGGDDADYNNIGLQQDPDADGMSSIFEELIGKDPFTWETSEHIIQDASTSGDHYVYSFEIENSFYTQISIVFQSSDDLDTWSNLATESEYANGFLTVTTEDKIAEISDPFVRIKIQPKK